MEVFVKFPFLAFLIVQTLGQTSYSVNLDETDLECIKELSLIKANVLSAFGNNFKVEEGDPEMTKFMKCAFLKAGYITDNNHVNVTGIKKWLTQWDLRHLHQDFEINNVKDLNALVDECLKKCIVNEHHNGDEIAIKTYNCLLDCVLWKRLY